MVRSLVVLALLVSTWHASSGQTVRLAVEGGRTAESVTRREAVSALQQSFAEGSLQLTAADGQKPGELWLEISADTTAGNSQHVTLRLPVSNTADVYGEERSCTVRGDGTRDLVFTAGLEEANYVRFAEAPAAKHVRFLLNRYLCRALAAPFHCNGEPVTLNHDWSQWSLGATSRVLLSSIAPSAVTLDAFHVQTNSEAFDIASCATIAPSSGLCCVSGKTTQWHCGGTPAGDGWHQVSGECFHRETGASCR